MFISDDLVFVELHKTAGTHIGKLLNELFTGVQHGKHNAPGERLLNSQRKFLGSIRNPWDWYVSLWAYGCDKKGLVYNLTTQAACANSNIWKQCYTDATSVNAFQDWLHMMNDKTYWNDFGEGYGSSPLCEHTGLLSYRYQKLFCLQKSDSISSTNELMQHVEKNCFIDKFVRMENLENDLIKALKSMSMKVTKSQKKLILSASKTNTSSRKNNFSDYYDKETVDLVNERDPLIINKFSYKKPQLPL